MMGRTHAATGVLAGFLLGPAVGLEGLVEVAPFAAACAGYALLPDLDHPGSTVTRKLGPITGALSAGLRAMSAVLYETTKGPRDERCEGTHRHFTHTVLFAAMMGTLCWATTSAWGGWAVLGWLAFGLLLAYDRLGTFVLVVFGIGTASWLPQVDGPAGLGAAALAALDESRGWLGAAVAAGVVVHCLGDALTESGCPFLFPLPIAGETWYELRPPRWLRFRTGTPLEARLVFPLVVAGCVAATPGVWPYLVELFQATGSRIAEATQ